MRVRMARLYYENGLKKALHTMAFIRPEVEGELSLREDYSPEMRRRVSYAYLRDARTGEKLRLYDAVTLYCVGAELIVRGIQVDEVTRRQTAQSWLMDILDVPVNEPQKPRWPREKPLENC